MGNGNTIGPSNNLGQTTHSSTWKKYIFPILLIFYEITTYLTNDMYLPALPSLVSDLNTTNMLGQLTLTFWYFGTASLQLVLGPVSDRYGRRPILLWGGVVFVFSTITCAITTDIRVLLIARFFQGSAVCSVVVAGYATLHDLYDHTDAIRMLTLMGSIMVLGPAFGPLVGSLVLYYVSWRNIFWLLAIWAAIALLLLWRFMPETIRPKQRHRVNFHLLLVSYYSIVKNKNFMFNALAYCLLFCGMITWSSTGPFLIIEAFHYTPLMFSVFQALIYGSFMLGSYFIMFYLSKVSTLELIHRGLIWAAVGSILLLMFAVLYPHYLPGTVISLMIFTAGAALASPLHRVAVETSQEGMGARIAIFSSAMSGFGALGSAIGSAFYNNSSLALAIIITLGTITALLLRWNVATQGQVSPS